ncbi:MAG: acyltransferase [Muribaculaceae bacterium]|nr:acyltransferase [Muribaculaceae bacterium]
MSERDGQLNGRLLNVSIFRVISMLMIVLFHCMCYCAGVWQDFPCPTPSALMGVAATFVVSLALPFFFFISGYLYATIYLKKSGYRDWKSFVVNKFKRLILPAVTWTIIILVLLPFRYSAWELVAGIQHLWFLPALFCVFIIARLLSPWLLAERKPLVDLVIATVAVLAVYLAYWAYMTHEIQDGFLIGRITMFMGYFIVGMMLSKHRLTMKSKFLELLLVMVLLGCHAVSLNKFVFAGQAVVDIFVIIAICVLLLDLLSSVKMKSDSMTHRLLNSLDKNGLGIYLVHQVLIMVLYQYTRFEEAWLSSHPYLGTACLFLLILPISWALAEFKRRLKLEPFL